MAEHGERRNGVSALHGDHIVIENPNPRYFRIPTSPSFIVDLSKTTFIGFTPTELSLPEGYFQLTFVVDGVRLDTAATVETGDAVMNAHEKWLTWR